jgi:hypothetical protein
MTRMFELNNGKIVNNKSGLCRGTYCCRGGTKRTLGIQTTAYIAASFFT